MKLSHAASLILMLAHAVNAAETKKEGGLRKLQGQGNPRTIKGTLNEVLIDYEDGTDEIVYTVDEDDGTSYTTDLTEDWVKANNVIPSESQVEVNGLEVANARVTGAQAMVIDRNPVASGQSRELTERKLTSYSVGTRSVLAVRIQDFSRNSGQQVPTFDEAFLANSVFGSLVGGSDPVNLASQYTACSHGQLSFVPANDRVGVSTNPDVSNIVDGVMTVTVNTGCTTNSCDGTLHNAATTAITNAYGQSPNSLATHVMYCLPPSSMGGIAYANLPGWRSVYSDKWCTYVSGQMHELGHNIYFHHSNEGTTTYADQSGMMGYSYSGNDSPAMCFNPAKSWESNWYDNNKFTFVVGTNTAEQITLKGIATVDTNSAQTALVKIDNPASSTDHYINFNHRTGFNGSTQEGGNQVMIVTTGNNGNGGSQSTLLAGGKLSAGGSWTGTINGVDITVAVESINTSTGDAVICVSQAGSSCDPCTSDPDCDDTLYCNGAETCDVATGVCLPGTPVSCDDGLFCNGVETCNESTDSCDAGSPVTCDNGNMCDGNEVCDEVSDSCVVEPGTEVDCSGSTSTCGKTMVCQPSTGTCVDDGNGEDGFCNIAGGVENCNVCPGDCMDTIGAQCPNGICEDGEDCVSCPQDCDGVTGGKPSNRFCCSGGPGGDCTNTACNSNGLSCSLGGSLTTCCGDDICEGNEDETNCAFDCAPAVCGDSTCDPGEDCSSCPGDCGACVCGDGTCDPNEDCNTCANDCGACPFCGDNTCDADEDCNNCAADCGACPFCGDGVCNANEVCSSCEDDCGACLTCGDNICSGEIGESCVSCVTDCGACPCGGKGSGCSADGDCCSNVCRLNNGRCA